MSKCDNDSPVRKCLLALKLSGARVRQFLDEKDFLSSELLQEVRSRMTKTIEIFNLPIAISCSLLQPADGALHVQSAPG